ncbi:MAG TPA: hypothetical protein VGK49_00255 [Ilumatobacteraceae bacterium]
MSSSVELVSASLCERCAQLYVVGDGPHTWPGSPPELSRATPGSLDFTELIRDAVLGGACA